MERHKLAGENPAADLLFCKEFGGPHGPKDDDIEPGHVIGDDELRPLPGGRAMNAQTYAQRQQQRLMNKRWKTLAERRAAPLRETPDRTTDEYDESGPGKAQPDPGENRNAASGEEGGEVAAP